MPLLKTPSISLILCCLSLDAGAIPFKFKSSQADQWIESQDFTKALNHFKGRGTLYQIYGYGAYQVDTVDCRTHSDSLTSSPIQSLNKKTALQILRSSNEDDYRIVSFNEKNQITYLVRKGNRFTTLYLGLSKR